MIKHVCITLCGTYEQLSRTINELSSVSDQQAYLSRQEKGRIAKTVVENVIAEIEKLNLETLEKEAYRATNLHQRLLTEERFSSELLRAELKHLFDDLIISLARLRFAFIPPPNDKYFEQDKPFGNEVYENFPSTREDLRDAGNCIATELYTAAVFHLMRVSELSLRVLAEERQVAIPIDLLKYREWQPIIKAIEDSVENLIANKPASKEKVEAQEFYRGLLTDFRALKDVFRNNVSHVRERFDEHQAKAALVRVEDVMKRLASRLREVDTKPIDWKF